MAKGGGAALVGIAAAGVIGYYLYKTGALDTNAAVSDAPTSIPGADAVKDKADAFIGTPAFYTACVAGALATVGVITWRRIGGWGRGLVLVAAAICITVLVTR